MVYGLTPSYLTTLLPPKHNEIHQYPTRHDHYYWYQMPHKSLQELISSFYDKIWNNLPYSIQQNPSLSNLKRFLISNTPPVPKLFYNGTRKCQILHARLRLECSSLNAHLYPRNIVNSPDCTWGGTETTQHFFFDCPIYTNQRRLYLNAPPYNINTETLSFGDNNLSYLDNLTIFNAVYKYIISSIFEDASHLKDLILNNT